MEKLLVGVFKHKEEIIFKIYDFGDVFYCELNHNVDWKKYSHLEKLAFGEAFKLPKQFSTIEDLRQGTKYWVSDFHFEWGI